MKRIVWLLKNLEEIISSVALAGMVLTTTYNVILRYIFKNSQAWATELSILFLIWATFIGAAVCWKKNMHYGMDFVADHFSEKLRFQLHRGITLMCTLLFAFLFVIGLQFTLTATKTTAFFRLSYKFLDISAVLGFASMTIYSVIYFIQSIVHPDQFSRRYAVAYEDTENTQDTGNS